MELTNQEKKILWIVLNNAQEQGMIRSADLITKFRVTDDRTKVFVDDWLRQTVEEYDVINLLKLKLCGDM